MGGGIINEHQNNKKTKQKNRGKTLQVIRLHFIRDPHQIEVILNDLEGRHNEDNDQSQDEQEVACVIRLQIGARTLNTWQVRKIDRECPKPKLKLTTANGNRN
jgi:hypothetical protein